MGQQLEVYYHIGFPKVASKFFQNKVFPRLEGVTFVKKHTYNRSDDLSLSKKKGKLLISAERDRGMIGDAEKILKKFPGTKFILFVRRHDDWLLSRYKYRIRKFGSESFREFFNLDTNEGLWKVEELNFRDKIMAIEKLSGTPPLVLTHDLLKKDHTGFIEILLDYIGTKLKRPVPKKMVHTAFNEKQLIGLRKWNRWFPYRRKPFKNRFSKILYRRTKQYVVHLVSFLLLFIPGFLFRNKTLLTGPDRNELKRIRDYFADDWAFCVEYEKKYRGDGGTVRQSIFNIRNSSTVLCVTYPSWRFVIFFVVFVKQLSFLVPQSPYLQVSKSPRPPSPLNRA
ncbi:MAG: hypothetical protein K9J30_12025 [Bacteroidales bacterium]|nr:hypothetical protein [Bacteroidales bacterium]